MEKTEKERKEREEQEKAITEEVIVNEKEKLRLELERMEEGTVTSEASAGRNYENDLTEVTLADQV